MEIDADLRCDHWQEFASKIQEWILLQNIPAKKLYFRKYAALEQNNNLIILFVSQKREINANGVETLDNQGIHASFVPGNPYIQLSGFPDCPERSHIDQAKDLIEKVLPQVLEKDPAKLEDRRKALEAERRKKSRENYISECSRRFERTMRETKEKIEQGKREIDRLQKELVKKIREANGSERKLEQLEACKGGEFSKYGEEFDKLLEVPKVIDVQISDGVIKIFTDILYCEDDRTKKNHEIGKFRIELYTSGSNGGVRWFNLTRQVDGHKSKQQAPHVWNDGSACLGNTSEIFPELIGSYEFAAASLVAINFVESANTNDGAGKHIDKWPLAEKAVAKN